MHNWPCDAPSYPQSTAVLPRAQLRTVTVPDARTPQLMYTLEYVRQDIIALQHSTRQHSLLAVLPAGCSGAAPRIPANVRDMQDTNYLQATKAGAS